MHKFGHDPPWLLLQPGLDLSRRRANPHKRLLGGESARQAESPASSCVSLRMAGFGCYQDHIKIPCSGSSLLNTFSFLGNDLSWCGAPCRSLAAEPNCVLARVEGQDLQQHRGQAHG